MKKIIILFAFLVSLQVYSQPLTGEIDTTRTNIIALYTAQIDTIQSLSEVYQYYELAILCDSTLKAGTDADLTNYILTKAGVWNYLGRYQVSNKPNWWFRKAYSETTDVPYQLLIWGITR